MNASLYIGATGLKGLAEGMNVVTNNIANANTVGYKQQNLLFSDLMYTDQGNTGEGWGTQQDSYVGLGQTGKGLQVDSVRTLFGQGGLESGADVTDLAIGGKGFFQVTTADGATRYTRAGNFRFDADGYLNLPDGSTLTGYAVDAAGKKGAAGPIQVSPTVTSAAQATSEIALSLNLGVTEDRASSTTNPYFGLLQSWDSNQSPPLSSNEYAYAQPLRVYDAEGNAQTLTLYVDGTPSTTDGNKTLEFILAAANQVTAGQSSGDAPLLSGTLTFNGAGQLTDMSAFTTTANTPNDLTTWTPAALTNGVPQFTLNGQAVTLDLGLHAAGNWTHSPASAAAVGADGTQLPSMGSTATRTATATTAYAGSSSQRSFSQNGYAQGALSTLEVAPDGKVVGSFTNGQSRTLYEIPICRFTSEDGLRREGNNLFSMTNDAGVMDMGTAGTENYGKINAQTLETSNVDMAREMVNMIVTQRGFQSNSKVITTADTMLQKAIELKR